MSCARYPARIRCTVLCDNLQLISDWSSVVLLYVNLLSWWVWAWVPAWFPFEEGHAILECQSARKRKVKIGNFVWQDSRVRAVCRLKLFTPTATQTRTWRGRKRSRHDKFERGKGRWWLGLIPTDRQVGVLLRLTSNIKIRRQGIKVLCGGCTGLTGLLSLEKPIKIPRSQCLRRCNCPINIVAYACY